MYHFRFKLLTSITIDIDEYDDWEDSDRTIKLALQEITRSVSRVILLHAEYVLLLVRILHSSVSPRWHKTPVTNQSTNQSSPLYVDMLLLPSKCTDIPLPYLLFNKEV